MIDELAQTPRLLVASDFDGTLAEIVDDPLLATPLGRSRAALEALAELEGTTVAIISGRRRSDLVERFDHPKFVLVGEHGADHGSATGPETEALAAARVLVDAAVESTPGARVEHKTRSVGFHYRAVAHPEAVVAELRRQASAIEGLVVVEGKKILELTDSSMSKGLALEELKAALEVDRALFMGDDVTDETAFAVLEDGDIGIHVGVGPTAAQLKVSSPSQLADFLEALVVARKARPRPAPGHVDNPDT